jgi:hypothetical protein
MAASPSGPHEPSIVTSQVFQALYRAVKIARLVYFPWHSAKVMSGGPELKKF